MKRYFVFLALTAIILSGCAPSLKDLKPALADSDSGNIWFANAGSLIRTHDSSRFKLGDPVVISGDLRFPAGAGPFPAVILASGCDGTVNAILGWASVLREWGYATFIIDSFSGRGLSKFEVCTTGSRLTPTQRIPDVYGALRILATHPKIDAHRVVLMGFSHHGGWLTLSASTVWAKKTFVSSGQPAFRAFFAFHPPCNVIYPELSIFRLHCVFTLANSMTCVLLRRVSIWRRCLRNQVRTRPPLSTLEPTTGLTMLG